MCYSKFLFRCSSCKMKIFFGFCLSKFGKSKNPRAADRHVQGYAPRETAQDNMNETKKLKNNKIKKKITTTLTWQWPPQKRGLTPVDKARRNEIVFLFLSARNKWFTSRNLRFTFTYNFLSQVILPLSFIMSNRKTLQIWFSLRVDYTFICLSKL